MQRHRGNRQDAAKGIPAICVIAVSVVVLFLFTPVSGHEKAGDLDRALLEAASGGNLEAVKTLVARGAKVTSRAETGETPLHLASTPEIASYLIARGADVNAVDTEFRMTPLFSHGPGISAVLIAAGADINARSKKGTTPLMWAVYWDAMEKARFLLSEGAAVNLADEDGKGPLHVAANWNKHTFVALLLSKGANVNAVDGSGWTPLHWASFEGGPEAARLLIAGGAKKNALTTGPWAIFPAGSTPVDIAERAKNFHVLPYLLSTGCKRASELR